MVECYKKIVCLGKTNWTLCSVLFGLLSTKGTKKKKTNLQHKTRHWLVAGEAARYRSVGAAAADLTHSPYRHQRCSLSAKTDTRKGKSTEHGKFWLRALESESVFTKALWEHLRGYFPGFLFPIIVFIHLTALLLLLLLPLFFFSSLSFGALYVH